VLYGIPAETKIGEHRVAITPESAQALISRNQTVIIQTGAGTGSGYNDDSYRAVGCHIAQTPMTSPIKIPATNDPAALRQAVLGHMHAKRHRSSEE